MYLPHPSSLFPKLKGKQNKIVGRRAAAGRSHDRHKAKNEGKETRDIFYGDRRPVERLARASRQVGPRDNSESIFSFSFFCLFLWNFCMRTLPARKDPTKKKVQADLGRESAHALFNDNNNNSSARAGGEGALKAFSIAPTAPKVPSACSRGPKTHERGHPSRETGDRARGEKKTVL